MEGDRARIAQLSKWVTQAAAAGDAQAMGIVREAAQELRCSMVDATRRHLGFGMTEAVAVSYSGGVFDNVGALLMEHFTAALETLRPGYRVSEPVLPPGIGAALYAAKSHDNPLQDKAIERLSGADLCHERGTRRYEKKQKHTLGSGVVLRGFRAGMGLHGNAELLHVDFTRWRKSTSTSISIPPIRR